MRAAPFPVLIAAACCISLYAGQQVYTGQLQRMPSQGNNTYTVTGTASNLLTGEPIRRALVHLQGRAQYAAFTGSDGRFRIENVLEGQYNAVAQKPGFFEPSQIAPNPFRGSGSAIIVGAATQPLSLTLVPAATITGRVVDNQGEPIPNINVECLSEQIVNGRKRTTTSCGMGTDEDGNYALENLVPGSYFIRVNQQKVFAFTGDLQTPNHVPLEVYPAQFYPNAPNRSSAQAIQLKPGDHAQIDFTLQPVPAFRVSGVVAPVGPMNQPAIETADGEQTGIFAQVNQQTGRWVLPAISAGSWKIVFLTEGQNNTLNYGEQSIDVRSANIQNVAVSLQPVPPVPVRVANSPDQGNPNLQLRLVPRNLDTNGREYFAGAAPGEPPGSLSVRDILPASYTVVAQAFGNGCIDSITSGSADLMRDDFVVSPGGQHAPIDVSFRNDCAILTVKLNTQDSASTVAVILASDNRSFEPRILYQNAASERVFPNLPPGEYRVYAFSNIEGLEYANPDALRGLAGQQITLSANQKAELALDVVQRGAN
ncbi:MAG: carboxypeptidase regulatory-like domain-containing protein [Acidobacteriaceae bacterium]|nr:carboxypeptidase regulatory-like domain-containing protein [Acidobacteriaceae bacterium]